ncbi:hypothetical protein D3C83_58690 [compost metagenome]
MKKILAAVGRKRELGEDAHQRFFPDRFAHQRGDALGIRGRIADSHRRRRHGDAYESVPVQVEEIVLVGH